MKKAVKIYIHGSVQDVFFRNFIKENADKLDLKGFVRNLDDGRVEVFAEGNGDEVDKMIEICNQGPKHAQIRRVDILNEKVQDMQEFKILHI